MTNRCGSAPCCSLSLSWPLAKRARGQRVIQTARLAGGGIPGEDPER